MSKAPSENNTETLTTIGDKIDPMLIYANSDVIIPDSSPIWYNKMSFSQLGDNGELLAEMVYIIPFIDTPGAIYDDEESEIIPDTAARTINNYFIKECTDFFTSSTRINPGGVEKRRYYMQMVALTRQAHGDSFSGLEFSVNATVTENSDRFYSVLQTTYWMLGGVGRTTYYASTFNRRTGEKLTITSFIKDNENEFINQLTDYIIKYALENQYSYDKDKLTKLLLSLNISEHEFYLSEGQIYYLANFSTLKNGTDAVKSNDGFIVDITDIIEARY
jgi:hypothetical protein